jgi:ubiquitin-protein ligase
MLVDLYIFQLNDPNPEDPLNWKAAELYKTNNLMLVYLYIFQLNDPNPEDPLNWTTAKGYKTNNLVLVYLYIFQLCSVPIGLIFYRERAS